MEDPSAEKVNCYRLCRQQLATMVLLQKYYNENADMLHQPVEFLQDLMQLVFLHIHYSEKKEQMRSEVIGM